MLRLRPYKACDARTVSEWLTDERTFYWWSGGRYREYPLTPEILNGYYEGENENDSVWAMTAYDENGLTGYLMMRFLDENKTQLRLCHIVTAPKNRGRGYGKEMVSMALRYGFTFLQAERISLGVYEDNIPARRCYASLGFTESFPHIVKTHTFMGKEWTCTDLEITRETYEG